MSYVEYQRDLGLVSTLKEEHSKWRGIKHVLENLII